MQNNPKPTPCPKYTSYCLRLKFQLHCINSKFETELTFALYVV